MLTVLNHLSGFQICGLLSLVNLILILVMIYTVDVCTAGASDIATANKETLLSLPPEI